MDNAGRSAATWAQMPWLEEQPAGNSWRRNPKPKKVKRRGHEWPRMLIKWDKV